MEAAAKKHEAIETDILAYEERVQAVVAVALELEAEYYHDIDRINARKYYVLRLVALSSGTTASQAYASGTVSAAATELPGSNQIDCRFKLSLLKLLVLQEMLYILDSMEELDARIRFFTKSHVICLARRPIGRQASADDKFQSKQWLICIWVF